MSQKKVTTVDNESINADEKDKSPDGSENDVYKRLNAYRPPENLLKKHPCKDCFNCLWCSDARCEVCLSAKGCGNCKKTSQTPDSSS